MRTKLIKTCKSRVKADLATGMLVNASKFAHAEAFVICSGHASS